MCIRDSLKDIANVTVTSDVIIVCCMCNSTLFRIVMKGKRKTTAHRVATDPLNLIILQERMLWIFSDQSNIITLIMYHLSSHHILLTITRLTSALKRNTLPVSFGGGNGNSKWSEKDKIKS